MFVGIALYNSGISSSPIYELIVGVQTLNWKRIASFSEIRASNKLIPGGTFKTEYKIMTIMTPRKGDIFVDNNKLISYGVSYSVSIDEIITFISIN